MIKAKGELGMAILFIEIRGQNNLQCKTVTFEFHNLDEVTLAAGKMQITLSDITSNIKIANAHANLKKKARKAEIIFKRDFFYGRFRESQDLECIAIETNAKCFRIYFDNKFSDSINLNEHVWMNDFDNMCIAIGEYSENELKQVHERLNYEFK